MDNQNKDEGIGLYQNPQKETAGQTPPAPSTVYPVQTTPMATSSPISPPPPPPPPPLEEGLFSKIFSSKIIKIVLGIFIILFILFVIFGLILPNFGKNKNEIITLTYWGLWEDSRVMQVIISDFERQNPQIKIDYSKQDPKEYRERLITRINNGTGPDIFRFHNTWYPMLSSVLLPLPDNVISKKEFNDRFYSVIQKDLIKNGAIYGIPLEIDTLALFVNNDIFESSGASPPASWEEFRDLAKSLTVKDESGRIKTSGAAIGIYSNINHAPDLISLLAVQNGADSADITKYEKQVSDALRFYTSFGSGAGSVWDSTLDPSILNFSKGNVAMAFGYSWDFFNIKALNPNLNFKVVSVPQLDKNNPKTIASYWVEGASLASKKQKEVSIFLKYLSLPSTQQKLYSEAAKTRLFGEPYSDVNLSESLKNDPNVFPFVAQAKNATSSYFVDSTLDNGMNSRLNNYLSDAVNSILSNTSPESATAQLFAGYNQVLKEYAK